MTDATTPVSKFIESTSPSIAHEENKTLEGKSSAAQEDAHDPEQQNEQNAGAEDGAEQVEGEGTDQEEEYDSSGDDAAGENVGLSYLLEDHDDDEESEDQDFHESEEDDDEDDDPEIQESDEEDSTPASNGAKRKRTQQYTLMPTKRSR